MAENEYNKETPFDKRITDVEDKIVKLQARLKRLIDLKTKWHELPYAEGEVAFHKEHGNVLIMNVDYTPHGSSSEEPEKDMVIQYTVIDHKGRRHKVPYDELSKLLDVSDATKVLYGKK